VEDSLQIERPSEYCARFIPSGPRLKNLQLQAIDNYFHEGIEYYEIRYSQSR
jgi:hypothetical protein